MLTNNVSFSKIFKLMLTFMKNLWTSTLVSDLEKSDTKASCDSMSLTNIYIANNIPILSMKKINVTLIINKKVTRSILK